MKPPGFFRASGIVAAKDLRLEWRTWATFSSMTIFSLIVLVVFNFAFDLSQSSAIDTRLLLPGVLWTVLTFASLVGLTRSFQLESHRETIAALFLAPVDRGSVFAGKFLANLIKIFLLELVLIPVTTVFFDYELLPVIGPLVGVLVLHTIGLAELGTMFAAIAVRVGRGEALLATLLLPAASPLIISAVECTAAVVQDPATAEISNWILLTFGFNVLYFFLALATFEYVLED